MKISLSWIKEFTDIDKRKAKEIADNVSVSLTEVENIDSFRGVDTILEIENKALTHRADCFSHVGIARELSAIRKTSFKSPFDKLNRKKFRIPKKKYPLKVEVENKELCPRYSAIVMKDITIKPSPLWIQERLLGCGVKPTNNVVDITNFVMLELGQPLHAFDYDKIETDKDEKKKIIVRNAKRNERITTLDGVQRELKKEMLVIADPQRAIAIAGVMGGANTEISEETTAVVIESANFEQNNIRRTGKMVGLHTEATLRYEKGQDPNLTYPALVRTVMLLEKYAGAKIISSFYDVYGKKNNPLTITINYDFIIQQLGFEVTKTEVKRILKRLEFDVEELENDTYKIKVPTFRQDITLPQDFVEEIARIYGYDQIVPALPQKSIKPIHQSKKRKYTKIILEALANLGMNETYSYSFVSDALYKKSKFSIENLMIIKNPISPELRYLRNSLVPSLLAKVETNSREYPEFQLFEKGREIIPTTSKKLPEEKEKIVGIAYSKTNKDTYFLIKGIVETVFDKLGITNARFSISENTLPVYEQTKSATINVRIPSDGSEIKGKKSQEKYKAVGIIGTITNEVCNNFNLNGASLTTFEFDLKELFSVVPEKKEYQVLSRYPSAFEDISFIVKNNIPVETLRQKILKTDDSIIAVRLEGVPFTSSKFGESKKSVTFNIEFQNPNKTLSSAEVKEIRTEIVKNLKKEYQVQLRQ